MPRMVRANERTPGAPLWRGDSVSTAVWNAVRMLAGVEGGRARSKLGEPTHSMSSCVCAHNMSQIALLLESIVEALMSTL